MRWYDRPGDEDSYHAVELRETLVWYAWSHLAEHDQKTILAEQTEQEYRAQGAPCALPQPVRIQLENALNRAK